MLFRSAALERAREIAAEAANDEDKNRAAADKGVPVVYSIRVQFDPKTCNSKG